MADGYIWVCPRSEPFLLFQERIEYGTLDWVRSNLIIVARDRTCNHRNVTSIEVEVIPRSRRGDPDDTGSSVF